MNIFIFCLRLAISLGGSLRGDERAHWHVLALAEAASNPSQTNKSLILDYQVI